jgi:hypothetical protein
MKVYKIDIEIPDGWVAVCEWNEHRGKGGAKGKYDSLLTAIKRHEIDYLSAGRPFRYYVRKDQADSYLAEQSGDKMQAGNGVATNVNKRLDDIEKALGFIVKHLEGNAGGGE